ncbi:MAG: diaminopropionate ammonia-lyase [Enterobacterales bacterium]|nr:diaminopropionate ammonia-lyase [Enterobacterales bacterium]
MKNEIDYLLNDDLSNNNSAISQLTAHAVERQVLKFHQSLPNYQVSPLVNLSHLANFLNVAQIRVKDESNRFGLKAFKGLGASYAMARIIAAKLALSSDELSFKDLIKHQRSYQDLQFATTTDGNHGKAVAWAAELFGCQSHVFMPKGSSPHRVNAVKQFSDHVTVTDINYDDTVEWVKHIAQQNDWILLQDTAWQGYQTIPDDIMRGYFSLISEIEDQDPEFWPSHVFLQAGVGSLAAAIAAYFVNSKRATPCFVLVEPKNADCFYRSIQINDTQPHRRHGSLDTIMAGLACGMPSVSAWEIIRNVTPAFIRCEDSITESGMRRYANPIGNDPAILSGESAAVTLGLLEHIMHNNELMPLKQKLKLDATSRLLLLSTEGDTDPDVYNKIMRE